MTMRESQLLPPWEDYIITDEGKVFNKHGRELKPQYAGGAVVIRTRKKLARGEYKTQILNIAQAVYKTFVEKMPIRRKVYHKDGNIWNCRADNLEIRSMGISEYQQKEYEKYAIGSVKAFVREKKLSDIYGFDVGNFIGEALLLIWLNLSCYTSNYKFVTWAWRYCNFAFKACYKKYKHICEYELNAHIGLTKK